MKSEVTTIYAGIDVHKRSWDVQCMSDHAVLKKFRITTPSAEKLSIILKGKYPNMDIKCAYEAGFCGFGIQRKLEMLGIDTLVVHPADIPTTDWEKRHKTDPIDCYKIANGLRSNMIKGIYIPEEEQTRDRSIVRYRYSIASDVRRVKNRIKSHLDFYGDTPQEEELCYWSKAFINKLEKIAKQRSDQTLLLMLEHLCIQRSLLAKSMAELRKMSQLKKYIDNVELLRSIPGVGLLTIMVYLTEIGDVHRFKSDDHYYSYIGFIPGTKNSGETERVGRLTKRGNKRVRTALVLSAWMSIRSCPKMLSQYEAYRSKNMPANKAIIKIARKLALIMKALIRDGKKYEPH